MPDRELPADSNFGEGWLDDDAGPVVPAFALTGGRTQPARSDLDLLTIVETLGAEPEAEDGRGIPLYRKPVVGPEHEKILELCHDPLSVAELASELDLALGVVRILLGDLLDYDLVEVREPARIAKFPNERVLKEVIDGLRAL
ncbi:MAG: hypothetical protein JWO67_1216 [Streptosporangiaceae bacterium]|jgi:hypothetical protein|nr:hypothetical protein [Streptosporangiaceae bacterium]